MKVVLTNISLIENLDEATDFVKRTGVTGAYCRARSIGVRGRNCGLGGCISARSEFCLIP